MLEFYGYPADFLEKYRAEIEKVTLTDLMAAQEIRASWKLAVLVVGNGRDRDRSMLLACGAPGANRCNGPQPARMRRSRANGDERWSEETMGQEQDTHELAVVIMAAGKGTRLKSKRAEGAAPDWRQDSAGARDCRGQRGGGAGADILP